MVIAICHWMIRDHLINNTPHGQYVLLSGHAPLTS